MTPEEEVVKRRFHAQHEGRSEPCEGCELLQEVGRLRAQLAQVTTLRVSCEGSAPRAEWEPDPNWGARRPGSCENEPCVEPNGHIGPCKTEEDYEPKEE